MLFAFVGLKHIVYELHVVHYVFLFLYFFVFFQAEDGIRDYWRDWSSDVCSSDLNIVSNPNPPVNRQAFTITLNGSNFDAGNTTIFFSGPGCGMPCSINASGSSTQVSGQARSEERRVGKGVDLGGRRIIKKKKMYS